MMRQPIAFFDDPKNSPGVLAAKLMQQPAELDILLGNNIAVVITILVTLLSCSILAIATGWKFGLVAVVGYLTPIFAAGLIRLHLENVIEQQNHQLYFESAGFASEFVGSIRTVLSLCMRETLLTEYRQLLRGPLQTSNRTTIHTMVFLALADSFQVSGMALAFW
jgi:ATP-binding cassette subfamily B (MDR/TAP) protein 1